MNKAIVDVWIEIELTLELNLAESKRIYLQPLDKLVFINNFF